MQITARCTLAFTCLLATSMTALAAPPPTGSEPESVLKIMPLNGDCRPDTIYGRMDDRFNWVPSKIAWGGSDSLHTPPCPGGPPAYPRRAFTTIEFPPYTTLSASISFDRVNQNDTARDLVLTYWWKLGDSATGQDTVVTIACFAQRGLDSIASINVATLHGFQMIPFFAMELHVGAELVEPAVRDASGRTSYILMPVMLSMPGPPPKTELADVPPWEVRVAPNPAHSSTEMTGRLVPAGDYIVEVVSVNGALERREDVSVAESGDLFKVIDLHDLASGYYVIVLHIRSGSGAAASGTASQLFGKFPIIITR